MMVYCIDEILDFNLRVRFIVQFMLPKVQKRFLLQGVDSCCRQLSPLLLLKHINEFGGAYNGVQDFQCLFDLLFIRFTLS